MAVIEEVQISLKIYIQIKPQKNTRQNGRSEIGIQDYNVSSKKLLTVIQLLLLECFLQGGEVGR